MLLDVIFLIPTLFTYCLILLLIGILSFIVVYISHKIYISIYDNLPLDYRGSNTVKAMQLLGSTLRSDHFMNQASRRSIWIQNRSQILHSTAVRIVLSLEPCYLACIELDAPPPNRKRAISFSCDCDDNMESGASCAAATAPRSSALRIIKYYEKLSKIPRIQVMLKCTQRSRDMDLHLDSNMRLMINDVVNDAVLDAQRSEPQLKPCRPAHRLFSRSRSTRE